MGWTMGLKGGSYSMGTNGWVSLIRQKYLIRRWVGRGGVATQTFAICAGHAAVTHSRLQTLQLGGGTPVDRSAERVAGGCGPLAQPDGAGASRGGG